MFIDILRNWAYFLVLAANDSDNSYCRIELATYQTELADEKNVEESRKCVQGDGLVSSPAMDGWFKTAEQRAFKIV
jgi:hypothetical protein